ncbi:YwqG family protein [Treponema zioleckii]|uniref:YwqG family protein n=1 Tax=Treponema zioleckii TaxID=331680 RepID=UPI00168B9028|nr:YwqG family protein [Treponema zioleckii]
MKYEIKIVKQGFLGKDTIDINKLVKGTDLKYGLFDEIGVLEEGKGSEDGAFFYQTEETGCGVFFKNQINEKTQSGEVVLTVNERITKKELYTDYFLLGKILNAVKKQFFTVKIYENGNLLTDEMLDKGSFFGKDSYEYSKIWEKEFESFKESTTDGFVQGPLFPLFMDKSSLNSFLSYSSEIAHSADSGNKYARHEFFTDSEGIKKLRFYLDENKSAIMPMDARTIKEHWKCPAVINISGTDFPYDNAIYELKKTKNVTSFDRRQFKHESLSNVQLKKMAQAVQKKLDTEQFPDFNFKLAVISNLVEKNPSFKEKYEEYILDYAEDHRDRKNDFLCEKVEEFFRELVLTESDLEKVTHLELSRENDFYFAIKPEWRGEDSLFDIENFRGLRHLSNLQSYSYDGIICPSSLLKELTGLAKSDCDLDETDYSSQDEEEENEDVDEDFDEEEENEEDDDSASENSLPGEFSHFLNHSASDEEKSFVKEMIIKYCSEYDEEDNEKNNRIGVIALYLNGSFISQNLNRETREQMLSGTLKSGYVKNYGASFKFVNDAIEANDEYKKLYHIFAEENDSVEDDEEETFYSKEDSLKILELVEKQTEIPSVEINIHAAEEPLPLTKSKFGGFPYWPKNMEYPTSKADGEKLVLLAQINFAEVPHLADFPESGILQFFIKAEDLYGCGFDGETAQDNWRIIFHENIEEPMTEDELRALGVKSAGDLNNDDECYFPLNSEFALSFEETVHSIGPECDDRFDNAVEKAAKELNLPVPEEAVSSFNVLNNEVYETFFDEYQAGHRISGYPYFTQSDPRSADDGYDVLLLQIDSVNDYGPEIMWGDSGVANFFIRREDLKKRDFSKVIYNWDCY